MKRWIKSMVNISEHSKPTDHHICRLLLPSFLGIILCMVCLGQTTWAWFNASVQTQPQTIGTANYDITVVIEDENNQPVERTENGYFLSANMRYTVMLIAGGTAPSGGYCIVNAGENVSYTEQILPGEMLSFILVPSETENYTLTAMWGSYPGEPNITDNCTIGEKMEIQSIPEEIIPVPEETIQTLEESMSAPEAPPAMPEASTPTLEVPSSTPEETSPMPEDTSPMPEETSPMPEDTSSISEETTLMPEELTLAMAAVPVS